MTKSDALKLFDGRTDTLSQWTQTSKQAFYQWSNVNSLSNRQRLQIIGAAFVRLVNMTDETDKKYHLKKLEDTCKK